jgi:5-methylcytosine-specific restriction endonuclease McrA
LEVSRKEQRRRAKRRRRALRLGAVSEVYTLAEIAARDRATCQLCGKRVAMAKQVPHSKAPTIDHVLPLARGGDDTRANVQLAHFLCNSLKSDGGSQQLALVG